LRGVVRARQSLVDHARGHRAGIAQTLADAVTALQTGRLEREISPILEAHAALAAGRRPAIAARLLGIAEALWDRHGRRQPALIQPAEHTGKQCRDALGNARFEREHRQGARLLADGGLAAGLIALLAPLSRSTIA
jgi:hypothetical protein